MYYCSLMLQDQTWPWNDTLELLPHIEVDHLLKFYPLMLSRTFLECYVAGCYIFHALISLLSCFCVKSPTLSLFTGNIEPTEAESMIKLVEDIFYNGPKPLSQALFASQHLTNRVVRLDKGKHYIYTREGLNPSDENSALHHYIQVLTNKMNKEKIHMFYSSCWKCMVNLLILHKVTV